MRARARWLPLGGAALAIASHREEAARRNWQSAKSAFGTNASRMTKPSTSSIVGVVGLLALAFVLVRLSSKTAEPRTDERGSATAPASGSASGPAVVPEQDGGDRAGFGEAMAKAAKEATPGLTAVRFVPDRFLVEWEKGPVRGDYFLDRSYREYVKLPEADRAAYIRKRASQVSGPELPATFAEAEPKLVPLVRERISHEIARIMAAQDPLKSLPPEPPHLVLTDELWGVLAYETDDQFVRIDAATMKKWNASFDQAWAGAVKRLEQRSAQHASVLSRRGLHELHYDDGNDSARILVPSELAQLPLTTDLVAAMPKEDLLLVAGANDDDALRAMFDRLVKEWDRGSQNMRIVRIGGGGKVVTPFELHPSHALYGKLADLQRSADQHDETLQREALKKRLDTREDAPFVASLARVRNQEGDEFSFVVHTEETPTLLARADFVVFRRVDLTKKTAMTLACGRWEKVSRLMKGRWKETALHPARWIANEHPTPKELEQLGCDQPFLRLDLGVARPYQ
jgi:hypothetical protein